MFEGGTRAVSFVHGARWLAKAPYVNTKLLHITDWMPTFLTLGGAKIYTVQKKTKLIS